MGSHFDSPLKNRDPDLPLRPKDIEISESHLRRVVIPQVDLRRVEPVGDAEDGTIYA